jgi:hypothetical protein
MPARHSEHEFTLSFRTSPTGAPCCFLTLIEQHPHGARSVEISQHLCGKDLESLIDDSLQRLRQHVLERVLFPESPF